MGVTVANLYVEAECLHDGITAEDPHNIVKGLKAGKSPGEDGVLAEMLKRGGDLTKELPAVTVPLHACHTLP